MTLSDVFSVSADAVYYPAQPLLDEYVLSSSGIMFTGCRKRMTVKPWLYGQVNIMFA